MDNQDYYFIIDFDIGLLEDVSVGVPAPPRAVVVQPVSPDTTFTPVQEQALYPDMILMQPVSPRTSMESPLLPYSSQTLSPDPMYFQLANPNQQHVVSCPSHHSSTEPVLLPSVEPVLSPYVMQITEETVHVQIKQQQVSQFNQDIAQNNQELTSKVPNKSGTSVASVHSFGDAADAPKKRGQKRKYAKKTKMYEMAPLMDEEPEKRSKNAVTAKQYREKQKNERESLVHQVELLTAENYSLKKQLEEK